MVLRISSLLNTADSRIASVVVFEIADVSPPITPAIATGTPAFEITIMEESNSLSVLSKREILSLFFAYFTSIATSPNFALSKK